MLSSIDPSLSHFLVREEDEKEDVSQFTRRPTFRFSSLFCRLLNDCGGGGCCCIQRFRWWWWWVVVTLLCFRHIIMPPYHHRPPHRRHYGMMIMAHARITIPSSSSSSLLLLFSASASSASASFVVPTKSSTVAFRTRTCTKTTTTRRWMTTLQQQFSRTSTLSTESMSATTTTTSTTTTTTSDTHDLPVQRHLVIVESPAKCATIEKILNDPTNHQQHHHNIHYTVTSCMGHIRNLPKKHPPKSKTKKQSHENAPLAAMDPSASSWKFPYSIVGIDLESGQYQPTYIIDEKKRPVVQDLQRQVLQADQVLLATDLDREGEAMAWHLADVLRLTPATAAAAAVVATNIPPDTDNGPKPTPSRTWNERMTPYHRIRFSEITKQAILSAVQRTFRHAEESMHQETDDASVPHTTMTTSTPPNTTTTTTTNTTTINENLVAAQETRRVLDRLAGFTVSPILWKKIAPGLSAGRVQSVGLQLIVGRERQRLSFETTPYYDLTARLQSQNTNPTTTTTTTPKSSRVVCRILSINGTAVAASGKDFGTQGRTLTTVAQHKYHLVSESDAVYWVERMMMGSSVWTVQTIISTKRVFRPPLPFKTSTLQQEAARRLGLTAQQTMRAAQQLYEVGCISYMRTDSTILSKDAQVAVEESIRKQFGDKYIEQQQLVPRRSKTDKFAQEAHEAIRPAIQANGQFYLPEELPATVPPGPAAALYRLIYQRTQAVRMPPLVTNQTQVTIRGVYGETEMLFRASGRVVVSPGYTLAYEMNDSDDESDDSDTEGTKASTQVLPPLVEGQILELEDLTPVGHETQPPPRYNEASFVKELEALGVGRPSTYASIVQTLRDRAYIGSPVRANDDNNGYGRGSGKSWTGSAISAMRAAGGQDFVGNGSARGPLVPSLSAFVVCALLEKHCPTYVDPHFTARMEERLDEIASGDSDNNSLSAEERRIEYLNEFYAGESGLAAQIKRIDETVDASIARRAVLPALSNDDTEKSGDTGDDQVGLFIGPWGPYVQKLTCDVDSEKPPTTSLPPSMAADISTINKTTLKALLATKQEGGTLLGQHPGDGRNIRIKTGRFGVYLQWGDDKEAGTTTHTLPKTRVNLRHVETMNDEFEGDAEESLGSLYRISLEEAVAYCELPRTVSTLEGKPITASFGPYGPYLKYNEKFVRLKPSHGDVFTIDAETAERLVLDGIVNAQAKDSKSVIAVVGMMYGADVNIKRRKYGVFVEWKDKSTKLPTEFTENPKDVTLEQAWSILMDAKSKQLLKDISEMTLDPESDAIHSLVMKDRLGQDYDTNTKKKPAAKAKKGKDVSGLSARPKRPLTSYLHFCAAQRPAVAESVKSLGEISKKLASLWAETSEADREVYVKMAAKSKLEYDEKMRVWQEEFMKTQPDGVAPSSKSSRSKSHAGTSDGEKVPSSVPRAPSAYMLFCRDERPKIVDEVTGLKLPFVETTQRLAAIWRECDATVKEKYQELASAEKAKLQQQQSDSSSKT